MLFLEIITLKTPFSDYDDIHVVAQILKHRKDEIPSELPGKLKDLIEDMRNVTYKNRPNASTVLEKLKSFGSISEFTNVQKTRRSYNFWGDYRIVLIGAGGGLNL